MSALLRDLTHLSVTPLNLAIRAVFVYLWVLILIRISGKRQIGQMGATEFVAVLLISNAVQNSMNAGDNSLVGGLWLAGILIAMSSTIAWLSYRYRGVQRVFEGTPTLLIHKGEVLHRSLSREQLRMSELSTLLRKQGIHGIDKVDSAILEADGTLSVVLKKDK